MKDFSWLHNGADRPAAHETQPTAEKREVAFQKESRYDSRRRGIVAVAASVLVCTSGFQVVEGVRHMADENVGHSAPHYEHELNGGDHVAHDVTVDVGYRLHLEHTAVEGITNVLNPIDLGGGHYALVNPESHNGIDLIDVTGTLEAYPFNGIAEPHKAVTDIARVYEQSGGETDSPAYEVVVGSQPGDISNIIHVDSTATAELRQTQEAAERQYFHTFGVGVGEQS